MGKVTHISKRKSDHIRINLNEDVRSGIGNGLDQYRFIHEALPEINFNEINLETHLFGKKLDAPILISSMTGGTIEAKVINQILAEAAQAFNIAMGVGSMRAGLEDPKLAKTFNIRKYAPEAMLFANLGAIQLNNGMDLDDCVRAIDMIAANALILHLNPLQEALQSHGNTNYSGLSRKIEQVCLKAKVPIIVKEVGWGISPKTARILKECGVAAIDVAGAGGTSWSQVEMFRAENELMGAVASEFRDWGFSTAESILNVRQSASGVMIFASGGITNGLEIAKSLALGAVLVGLAGPFLKAAAESADGVHKLVQTLEYGLKTTLFVTGSSKVSELQDKIQTAPSLE